MGRSSKSSLPVGFIFFVASALMPVALFAADVDVYAEGAYTASDLVVYIYADTTGSTTTVLRSAGVKLTYKTYELTFDSAEKNESVWFLGTDPYMDPENTIVGDDGEVVIVLGKLDTDDPAAGVSGDRVLLGKVTFTREGSSMPFAPTLALGLGKTGDFANFVDTGVPANVLDDDDPASITFGSMTVRERGDANADGSVTPADIIAVRNAYYGDMPLGCEAAADCNDDSSDIYPNVTPADMICIRNKYYSP